MSRWHFASPLFCSFSSSFSITDIFHIVVLVIQTDCWGELWWRMRELYRPDERCALSQRETQTQTHTPFFSSEKSKSWI